MLINDVSSLIYESFYRTAFAGTGNVALKFIIDVET